MPEILLSFCICFSWRDSSPAAADVEAMIVCGGVVVVVAVFVQSCQAKLCERTKRGCLWTASAVVNEWQARSGAILSKGKCRPVW